MADAQVTLGLDAREFDARLAAVEQRVAGAAKNMGKSFTGLGGLGGLLGAGAVGAYMRSVVEYGAKIEDLHEQFGVSTDAIQKFGNVAEKNGSSLEGMAMGFKRLDAARSKALEGDQSMADAFLKLGVSLEYLRKNSPEEIMTKIGASSMNAAEMVKILGKNALELVPTLGKIADGTAGITDAISAEHIKKLKQADDFWKSMAENSRIVAANMLAGSAQGYSKAPGLLKENFEVTEDAARKAFHGHIGGAASELWNQLKGVFGFGDQSPMANTTRAADLILKPGEKPAAKGAAKPGDWEERVKNAEDHSLFENVGEAGKLTLAQLAGRDASDMDQATFRGKYIGKDIMAAQAAQREKEMATDAAVSGNEDEFNLHNKRFQQLTSGIGSLKDTEKNVGMAETVKSIEKSAQEIVNNTKGLSFKNKN